MLLNKDWVVFILFHLICLYDIWTNLWDNFVTPLSPLEVQIFDFKCDEWLLWHFRSYRLVFIDFIEFSTFLKECHAMIQPLNVYWAGYFLEQLVAKVATCFGCPCCFGIRGCQIFFSGRQIALATNFIQPYINLKEV